MSFKWEDCLYLKDNEITKYFLSKGKKILYFIGKGFDPRMCEGIKLLSNTEINFEVCLLHFTEGPNSTSNNYNDYIQQNYEELKKLSKTIYDVHISTPLSRLPIFLKKEFTKDFFQNYEEVIIDISSMPVTISFNLIKYIINLNLSSKVSILTCENSEFDDAIIPTGFSETANYLNGFSMFSMDLDSLDNIVTVWLPILGKNCKEELEKIHAFISPNEICPVLPFPSRKPRRSDEILYIVGELLFSSFKIEKKNILYVTEDNIIQVYKKLYNVVEYYNEALGIIGNTKFIFSISSSKLIGLGALLASMEISDKKNIQNSFALVENDGYIFDISNYDSLKNSIYCLCLDDSIYNW